MGLLLVYQAWCQVLSGFSLFTSSPGRFIMPVLEVRKVRHRVVKECALSHTAEGHVSGVSQPGSQAAELTAPQRL